MRTVYETDASGRLTGATRDLLDNEGREPQWSPIQPPDDLDDPHWVNNQWQNGPVVAPVIVPNEISRRQFFQLLALRGLISKHEALSAMQSGTLPDAMQNLINQIADEDTAFAVEISLIGAAVFERYHDDTLMLAHIYGWNTAFLDAFWIAAARL